MPLSPKAPSWRVVGGTPLALDLLIVKADSAVDTIRV
jgi:hypothetical protein